MVFTVDIKASMGICTKECCGFVKFPALSIFLFTRNTDEHTAGCLLFGDSQQNNAIKSDGFIGSSVRRIKEFTLR